MSLHEFAKSMTAEGYSVIPILIDKKAGPWKKYQTERMSDEEIPLKFNGATKIAIITGQVSGGLEAVDVDLGDIFEPFRAMVNARHPDLLDRLIYYKTPNGFGLCYRHEGDTESSQKLAKGWVTVDGDGRHQWNGRGEYEARNVDGKWYIEPALIETRGGHAYFLTTPSPNYEILSGDFKDLQPITKSERDSILTIARTFNESPDPISTVVKTSPKKKSLLRIPFPGDVYAKEIDAGTQLEECGWTKLYSSDGNTHYARPGREREKKIGATVYADGKAHIFTSSGGALQEGKQYNSFSILTLTEYDGDYSKSTKAVVDAGFIPDLTVEEVREILKDNPDEIESAYKRSGLSETQIGEILVELGYPLPEGKSCDRIEIPYSDLETYRVTRDCDIALSTVDGRWGYYRYMDSLGFVRNDNHFQSYDLDNLEMRTEASLYMTTLVKGQKQPIRVPNHILKKLLSFPDSSAPVIKGFAKHPSFTPDGQLVGMKDGYENGYMFSGCTGFKVDERSFKECYNRIVELFCHDILFEDEVIGPTLFVSMMMTAMCRLTMTGGCPGYFITANEPGTGKSTLFEFISRSVFGELIPSISWGTEVAERDKSIISALKEGVEGFLFDNIPQGEEVSSPMLAQALTAGTFKARLLGGNDVVNVPAECLFVFVGNNLNMSTELSRRLLTVGLLAKTANPAHRHVKIKDVRKHCEDHRHEVIGCLLKMLQEGFTMSEEIENGSGHSFWDKLVRSPLLTETGVDILTGFEKSAESSYESGSVGGLLGLLADVFGVGPENSFTSKDVFLAIADNSALDRLSDAEKVIAEDFRKHNSEECVALRDGMIEINARSAMSTKSTGRVMSEFRNRVSGEYRLAYHATKSNNGAPKHWLEKVLFC